MIFYKTKDKKGWGRQTTTDPNYNVFKNDVDVLEDDKTSDDEPKPDRLWKQTEFIAPTDLKEIQSKETSTHTCTVACEMSKVRERDASAKQSYADKHNYCRNLCKKGFCSNYDCTRVHPAFHGYDGTPLVRLCPHELQKKTITKTVSVKVTPISKGEWQRKAKPQFKKVEVTHEVYKLDSGCDGCKKTSESGHRFGICAYWHGFKISGDECTNEKYRQNGDEEINLFPYHRIPEEMDNPEGRKRYRDLTHTTINEYNSQLKEYMKRNPTDFKEYNDPTEIQVLDSATQNRQVQRYPR